MSVEKAVLASVNESPALRVFSSTLKDRFIFLSCLVFLLIAPAPAYSESIEYGLQNPALRAHFRSHLLSAAYATDRYGRPVHRVNPAALERSVERLTAHFLTELGKKLKALKSSYQQVSSFRQSLLSEGLGPQSRGKLLKDWSKMLDELEDNADDLKDSIRMVMPGVKSKTEFRPEVNTSAENPAFGNEIAFIGSQIEQAERGIRDFFFTPNHTVTVDELAGDNLLIQLYRVEKLSKQIRVSL